MNSAYMKEIEYYASDILRSENMLMTTKFIQHGEVSVYAHSLLVTISCLKFADKMHIKVDRCSLVRGALLHDYFLYDWHESTKKCRPHGFTHAKTALMNAKRDFEINEIEAEMIYCHMFPMNILRVPKHRESIILEPKILPKNQTSISQDVISYLSQKHNAVFALAAGVIILLLSHV